MQKDTGQRKVERQFQQHLTRTKDIIALKAKRLNETGKVYFLESTYTQITVTFLAESACSTGVTQCTGAKTNIWDTYYQSYDTQEQTISMQKEKTGKS